jgi:hypothetical protein
MALVKEADALYSTQISLSKLKVDCVRLTLQSWQDAVAIPELLRFSVKLNT